MIPPFVTALILIYFIYDQFEFSSISRISFWIIPILTMYQFFNTVKWSKVNLVIILILILFAIAVGYYQADHTKIRLEETSSTFFRDQNGQEVPIYRKVVTAQGGRHYLYGWLIILIVQILLEVVYLHEKFIPLKIWDVFVEEVIADIFSFTRFVGSEHTSWIIWALISFTSFSYTLWIAQMSPIARRKLFKQDKFVRVAEEDKRK
ncbi:hypothetical protein FD29_GL001109 [Companilactobacillus mindensis DSM 14500]|uniref:Hydrophobic protein n=1 Tax=Companilactobacillus mindensis DSM 14500 TaxID=1423770 RepID=A0A0R1QEY5_9LACO|nr:hypothetical protein [Companilactobacillus mindensis]KRL43132.1 hypothetical protein FD29_GL001109 [Companilactobacillus mindensis DSM 14500]GEO78428.1 hypothetical protein LMI01_07590 [Companilactobacillus mindensis]